MSSYLNLKRCLIYKENFIISQITLNDTFEVNPNQLHLDGNTGYENKKKNNCTIISDMIKEILKDSMS